MEVFKKSPKETSSKKTSAQTSSTEIEDIETEDIILDEDLEEDNNSSIDLEDNLLEEEDDDASPIGVITDVMFLLKKANLIKTKTNLNLGTAFEYAIKSYKKALEISPNLLNFILFICFLVGKIECFKLKYCRMIQKHFGAIKNNEPKLSWESACMS